jgi:hypothetical protein
MSVQVSSFIYNTTSSYTILLVFFIMKTIPSLLFVALSTSVSAWMPGVDKDIFHETEGHDLFKRNVTTSKRWLPGHLPIRGVNLGSMFVAEPWMSTQ